MTLETFINAMPKVELHVYLEGAVSREILSMIADQNEIPTSVKHFQDWLNLVSKPDFKRLYDLIRMTCGWLQTVDDVTRIVYELGVALHKQNVVYAEVSVNPLLYTGLNLTIEDFMAAVHDGRERARRAWGIEMAWIVTLPRDEPRRADEIARFVTTATARRYHVVGLGLSGNENAQPVGQFERAFKSVEKKDVPRIVRAGDYAGLDGVQKALEVLLPSRIVDGRGAWESPELMARLIDQRVPVCVSPRRALAHGWASKLADYPLRKLYDEGVTLIIGSDMPTFYGTLSAQYRLLVEQGGFTTDELEDIALAAVRMSYLPDEEKAVLEGRFREQYAQLRAEHLPQMA
jgi:aminodeoxyfutalosine deaminase